MIGPHPETIPSPETSSQRCPPTQQGGPPTESAVERAVVRATDELCHVTREHLARDVIASACAGRRMLPIVPGTGPGLALVGSPGSTVHCQSARPADSALLSRHISMMCFPVAQRSSEI